jgi:hypothetical protein
VCEQAWKHGYPPGVGPIVTGYTLATYKAVEQPEADR